MTLTQSLFRHLLKPNRIKLCTDVVVVVLQVVVVAVVIVVGGAAI